MTAAAVPVMCGPGGMRLFLVAAPAAIIAALLAAASTNGNTSPVAQALAPGPAGNMPGTPAGSPHLSPAQAPRVRAGERETVLGRCSHPAGNPPGATSSMRADGVPQHRACVLVPSGASAVTVTSDRPLARQAVADALDEAGDYQLAGS